MPTRNSLSPEQQAIAFGRRVKELRQAKGLEQSVLAKRAKMTQARLSLIEHGHSGGQGPKLSTVYRLATALAVPPGELLKS